MDIHIMLFLFFRLIIIMTLFLKSARNQEKMIFEGFIYLKNRNGEGGKRYWRCENWFSCKCHGTAITDKNNLVTLGKEHNHAPSPARVELARIKNNINQAAITSTLSPREVVNLQLEGISEQAKVIFTQLIMKNIIKVNLPKLKNLEKTVGRKRHADGRHVPTPQYLSEINIPEHLRLTKTDLHEDFVIADTGHKDANRIIILGSTTDINRLASCEVWLCDSTFQCCTENFYQLWIIYGRFRQSIVLPFVYALLPNKTRESYQRALHLILNKIDEITPGARPNVVVIDFEREAELALRTELPMSSIYGCYFHYRQSIWRKIQEIGWSTKYKNEEQGGFGLHLKMFAALTFIDTVYVRDWFRHLARIFLDVYGDGDMDGPFIEFIDYMERTWVGRDFLLPRFSLEMWNNRNITIDQLPRATNSVEFWHNSFAIIFKRHASNLYNLIKALLDEQIRSDAKAIKALSGEVVPQFSKAKYRRENECLLKVLRGDGRVRNPIDFLTACAHYIRF